MTATSFDLRDTGSTKYKIVPVTPGDEIQVTYQLLVLLLIC